MYNCLLNNANCSRLRTNAGDGSHQILKVDAKLTLFQIHEKKTAAATVFSQLAEDAVA